MLNTGYQSGSGTTRGRSESSLGEVDVEDNPDGERKKTRQNVIRSR